jgi:phosphoacetylglucosamine mutase
MYSVGILAAIRAFHNKKVTGVMITASHNEYTDNGVKIIDSTGEMLEPEWEKHAELLANSSDNKQLIDHVDQVLKETNTKLTGEAIVYIAKDTRPTSEALSKSATEGCLAMGAKVKDFGLLTTPQLHFMVNYDNTHPTRSQDETPYYKRFSEAFKLMVNGGDEKQKFTAVERVIDCAFGVGGTQMRKMIPYLKGFMDIKLINDPTPMNNQVNISLFNANQ